MTIRRAFPAALAVAAVLALSGCVQMHSETVIDEDGSGSASLTLSMSAAVAEAMAEMQEMDPDAGPGGSMPAFEDIDRDLIERRIEGYGVEIKTFEKAMVDGRETLTIAYEFEDMEGLSAMMQATMAGGDEGEENGLAIFDAGDGNLVLRPAHYDLPDWGDEEEAAAEDVEETAPSDMDPDQMQRQMEIMGKLMGSMAELDIRMAITVPGDIVSTSAMQQEGRTAVWAINAENMMTAGQDMEPVITFSGKGLKIEPRKD